MKIRQAKRRIRSMSVWRGVGYGPTLYVRKHATWPAAPTDLASTARVTACQHRLEDMYEKACRRACELDSPNSPDFESLLDSVLDELEEIT